MKKNHPVTLQFLAEQLDIHVSTVSRVLHGNEETIAKAASKATIARIRSFASQHNYKPNPHAIGLRTQKSKLIGVSVPRLSDYIWASIYEGIEDAALNYDYFAYVTNSYDNPDIQHRQQILAQAHRVDGLILGDVHTTQSSLDFLHSLPLPFVQVLRHAGDFLSVTCDDIKGGELAAQHLFEQGHRNVAIIGGLSIASTGIERTAGFTAFYQKAGYPIPPERIISSNFDTQAGHDATQHLFTHFPTLTAIYAVNDFAAIGAMGAMRKAGHIPGTTIALVGYNDTPLAAELPIPLTSIQTPLRTLGIKAMELLLELLQNKPCKSILLQPTLMIRESSRLIV